MADRWGAHLTNKRRRERRRKLREFMHNPYGSRTVLALAMLAVGLVLTRLL